MRPVLIVAFVAAVLTVAASSEAAFPGANGKIAFTRHGAIYVVNGDGSGLKRLTRESFANRAYNPRWSPDGTKIVYSRSCAIYVMNGDGTRTRKLTRPKPNGLCAYEPAWSPDGRRIAFAYRRGTGARKRAAIYVMRADGTGQRPVSQKRLRFNDVYPAWSPDGTTIAFARQDFTSNPDPKLFAMSAEGTRQRRLTNDRSALMENMPVWSPDGARIAFGRGFNVDGVDSMVVAVVDATGGPPRNLIPLSDRDATHRYPAWSPNGRKIVYIHEGLVVMESDGSDKVRLTTGGDDDAPDWQPVK